MTCAEAIVGSVMEMRFNRSVVLISNDLPAMTRSGAAPWGCWGRVVVWVAAGFWGCCAGACCGVIPARTGSTNRTAKPTAPNQGMRSLVFQFPSR